MGLLLVSGSVDVLVEKEAAVYRECEKKESATVLGFRHVGSPPAARASDVSAWR